MPPLFSGLKSAANVAEGLRPTAVIGTMNCDGRRR
jgi:hypothetical protein